MSVNDIFHYIKDFFINKKCIVHSVPPLSYLTFTPSKFKLHISSVFLVTDFIYSVPQNLDAFRSKFETWKIAPLNKQETILTSQERSEITCRNGGNRMRVRMKEVGWWGGSREHAVRRISHECWMKSKIFYKNSWYENIWSRFSFSRAVSQQKQREASPLRLAMCPQPPRPLSNPFPTILIPSHSVFKTPSYPPLSPAPKEYTQTFFPPVFSFRTLKFHSPLNYVTTETFALVSVKQKSLQLSDGVLVCFVQTVAVARHMQQSVASPLLSPRFTGPTVDRANTSTRVGSRKQLHNKTVSFVRAFH